MSDESLFRHLLEYLPDPAFQRFLLTWDPDETIARLDALLTPDLKEAFGMGDSVQATVDAARPPYVTKTIDSLRMAVIQWVWEREPYGDDD